MTPAFVLAHTIPAALSLLPPAMDTPEARVMLLAIGLQESRFAHRVQIDGPARGYWQFENAGALAVLHHKSSQNGAIAVCDALGYRTGAVFVYDALSDNDVLACAFARLLLWTLPNALPATADDGWRQYLKAWRPGRPHPETWAGNWELALETVQPPVELPE